MNSGTLPTQPGRRTVRLRAMLVVAILVIALGISLAIGSVEDYPTLCPFRAITTVPCASCGMTRAFIALGHGDIETAVERNIASPVVFAGAWMILVLALVQLATGREMLSRAWKAARATLVPAILILMAVAWGFNLWHRFG